jgi:hypothetical protein
MQYIKKIEEHIIDNIEGESDFLNRIKSINKDDLIVGEYYKHIKEIKVGEDTENIKTLQKFIKRVDDFFIFKISKIYTTTLAKKMGIKNGDLIKVKEKDLNLYH